MPKPAYWRVARPVVTVRGQAYKKYIQQMAANPDLDINLLLLSQSQPIDFQRVSQAFAIYMHMSVCVLVYIHICVPNITAPK